MQTPVQETKRKSQLPQQSEPLTPCQAGQVSAQRSPSPWSPGQAHQVPVCSESLRRSWFAPLGPRSFMTTNPDDSQCFYAPSLYTDAIEILA